MKYFENLTVENEIKLRYKQLAKEHHPDLGGCVETMKTINAQYESVLTGAYQRAGKSISEIDELIAQDNILREKLNEIIQYPGVNVELCGSWLWVSGETKPLKELLKSSGFNWAAKKLCWFWRSDKSKSKNRKTFTLDEIRSLHGSKTISGNFKLKLA